MHTFTLSFLFVLFVSYLPAQEWVRQHPSAPLVDMYDVAMHADGHGIGVGTKGQVYITDDFGGNWQDQSFTNGFSLRQASVEEQGDELVYLILSTNTFYQSSDAGDSWQSTSLDVGSPNYLDGFANTYLAGGSEALRRSTDNGLSWVDKTPGGGTLSWRSFFFLNAQKGWAASTTGELYRTSDGGDSWTELTNNSFDDDLRVAFVNDNLGYAGQNRDLYKTTDGGDSWTEVLPDAFGSHVNDIAIIDAERVVFTQGNRTFYTHDGGQSVTRIIPTSYPGVHRGAAALPDGQVWVTGSYGVIAHSDDAGLTYEDQIPGNKNALAALDFLDAETGWAFGRGPTVLRTLDGGDNWLDVSPPNEAWESADVGLALSASEVWIGGQGYIAHTTDAGQSWTQQLMTDRRITGLVQTADALLASATGGSIFRSTDNGLSWSEEIFPLVSQWLAIHFTDDLTGYVSGWNGAVAKTSDGGTSWTMLDIPTDKRLDEIFFLTQEEGWILSDHFSDTIYHTTNGGTSWEPQMVISTIWNHIHFVDPMHGFLLGGSSGNGLVYETMNGGVTWEQVYRADQAVLGFDIDFATDATRIWISGVGGMIEKGTRFILDAPDAYQIEALNIHPNPAGSVLHLDLPPTLSADAVLQVFAADGQRLLQQKVTPQISLQHLPSGWYHIQLIDEQKIYQARLIKGLD